MEPPGGLGEATGSTKNFPEQTGDGMNRLPSITGMMLCWLVAAWLAASAGMAGAGPLVLTEKDSGRTLTVNAGQRLVVDLKLGAGHHQVAPEFNPEVLTLVGQSLQSMTTPQGASSRIIYEFLVRQGGSTDLVIGVKGSGNQEGQSKPLLKVKIVAAGGGGGTRI
jgi:hypothetical protein